MIDRAACEYALTQANTQAFLRVIRQGETNQTDAAYRTLNGGEVFADLSRHPYDDVPTTQGGKAAGAYQFLGTTWAGVKVKLELHDFSPASQDLGAVALIQGRGALQDVLQGSFDAAVSKCRREWTSLPGATENNPKWTLDKARALYQSYGGTFVPHETLQPEHPSMPIAALISLFGPPVVNLIPQLGKLFGGSEVATRNVEAASLVFDTITKAAGAANVQDAVEKMQADPALTAEVTKAVVTHPEIIGLLEVGGGIEKAREAGLAMQNAEKPFWYNPLFVMSCVLLPMASYVVFASVTGGHPSAPWWVGTGISDEAKVGIISSVISLILGGICGIWFGTSYGSQRKDERAAAAN